MFFLKYNLVNSSWIEVRGENLKAFFAFDGNCKDEVTRNTGHWSSDNVKDKDRFNQNENAVKFPNQG